MSSLAALLLGVVMSLIGLATAIVGGRGLRAWWMMRQIDPSDMVVESGMQELEGTAHAIDEPVESPFTGSQSLICTYRVERWDPTDGPDDSNWDTVTTDVEAVPFEIENAGPKVAVDPENASPHLTTEFQLDTMQTDTLPERIRKFEDDNLTIGSRITLGSIDIDGMRYRFTEERLDQGEQVYVFGPVEQNSQLLPHDTDARFAIAPSGRGLRERLFGNPFVISDVGEEQATRRKLKPAAVFSLFALVCAGLGLRVLLFFFFGI